MKKRRMICAMAIFLSVHAFAERISIEKAEKVVKNYLQSTLRADGKKSFQFQRTVNDERLKQGGLRQSDGDDILYYVFSVNNDEGFIIVSGDDVAVPVLGYSDHGNYDTANPNFAYWMECLAQEISYAKENRIPQQEEIKIQWQKWLDDKEIPLRELRAVVYGPLLTTKWNQTSPYNNLCPTGTYTGCVATAMAQIMKKHNTPVSRTVTIPAYTTITNKTAIPAIPGVAYDWSSMIDTYNSNSPAAAKTAVATLMYHCGAAVQMDYTTEGSGAFTSNAALALINYFGYDQSIQLKQRKDYSNADWENLLRTELSAGRPVYYAGSNTDSGHAFVCEGYDSNGTFYFNWGWGGYQDGYFVTTALSPSGGGAGSGSGTYNSGQEIIIQIKPDAGGAKHYELRISDSKNITSTKASVARGEIFTVDAPVRNAGLFSYTGDAGVALVNGNTNAIIAIIGQIHIPELGFGYYYNSPFNFSCAVPASVGAGNYKLRIASKVSGASEWTIISGTPGYTDVLDLTVTSSTVADNSNLVLYNGNDPTFVIKPNPMLQYGPVSIDFGIYNGGQGAFTGFIELGLYSSQGDLIETIENRNVVVPNDGYYYPFTFTSSAIVSPGGTYALTLYQKNIFDVRKKVGNYSQFTNGVSVTVTGTTGTDEIAPSKIKVYSRHSGAIQVASDDPIQQIILYNLQGQKVYDTARIKTGEYTVDNLARGVYIVKTVCENATSTVKIRVK